MPTDTHAPPPDLDIPAARVAARAYAMALARGIPEPAAWEGASSLFSLSHPAWPLPLAEREAARTVGALIAQARVGRAAPSRPVPPGPLLLRLAEPTMPGDRPPSESDRAAPRPVAPRPSSLSRPLSPHLFAAWSYPPPHPVPPGAAPC